MSAKQRPPGQGNARRHGEVILPSVPRRGVSRSQEIAALRATSERLTVTSDVLARRVQVMINIQMDHAKRFNSLVGLLVRKELLSDEDVRGGPEEPSGGPPLDPLPPP